MKYVIALGFVCIIGALMFAGVAMVRKARDGQRNSSTMMRALATRVALSILLFACIWLAHYLGWIQPTGLPVR